MKRIYCLVAFLMSMHANTIMLAMVANPSKSSTGETKHPTHAKAHKDPAVGTSSSAPISGMRPFSYEHTVEIAYNNTQGFELNPQIEAYARKLNQHLDGSIVFDTKFVGDAKKVREYHLKQKHAKQDNGELMHVMTKDGLKIHCTFFDRNSNKLLVIAPGFTNAREKMTPFLAMFPDHDIVIFDFRGHGYNNKGGNRKRYLCQRNVLEYVSGINIDASVVTLGDTEHLDVLAIVKTFKARKTYTAVHGLGVCYGAFVLLKTAAIYKGLFDKIVLDGSWLSRDLFIEKIRRDPKLMFDPQAGGWQNHWFWTNKRILNFIEFFLFSLAGLPRHDLSLTDYIHKITNTELLFFHSKNDLTISRAEFETIWNGIGVNKTAIITSNPHVRNHWKQNALYKLTCDLFFTLDQKNFIASLQNSTTLRSSLHSLVDQCFN